MNSVFDVSSFGAVGDGRSDDTGAVKEAVRACAASHTLSAVLRFPAGNYLLSEGIVLPSSNQLIIEGAGIGASRITWSSSADFGLRAVDRVNSPANLLGCRVPFLHVRGLSLVRRGLPKGSALEVAWRAVGDFRAERFCEIDGLEIRGDDPAIEGWALGVKLTNCHNTMVHNISVVGGGGVGGMSTGLQHSSTTGETPSEFHLSESTFYFQDAAIHFVGKMEGLFVHHVTAVQANRGLWCDDGVGSPLLDVRACHFDVQETAICCNKAQSIISDNLLYLNGNATKRDGALLAISPGCSDVIVQGNMLLNIGTTPYNGIVVAGCTDVDVFGNHLQNFTTGIWSQQDCRMTRVFDNRFRGCHGTVKLDGHQDQQRYNL